MLAHITATCCKRANFDFAKEWDSNSIFGVMQGKQDSHNNFCWVISQRIQKQFKNIGKSQYMYISL